MQGGTTGPPGTTGSDAEHRTLEFVDEDGHLRLQENVTRRLCPERNVREQADTLAYRFIDYQPGT